MAREAPPRRDNSGSASIALRASPYWRKSHAKVRGPTLPLRIRRSQSSRSVSVRAGTLRLARSAGFLADLALSSLHEAVYVGAMHKEGEDREHGEQQRLVRHADKPEDHRSRYGGDQRGE